MHEFDPLIDAALDSIPLSPTPPGLRVRVMNQITHMPVERFIAKQPAFRLDFLDLALPAFFAFLASLGFAAVLGVLTMLDPLRREHLELGLKSTFWRLPVIEIGGILLIAGVSGTLLLLALLAAAFLIKSPKFQEIIQ